MEKKVSVIIPFYNGVELLCEAVQSVLDQTYKNFEIIVVNDGSTENLDAFINKYGTKIIYKFQENKGPAAARNFAMSFATGEYVAFLDSDDIWLPTKTEKQIAFMEDIGAMWSHTGFYYWKPVSDKLKVVYNSDNYGDITKKFLVSTKIATPSVIINSDLLKKYPSIIFPENYRTGEDTRFFKEINKYYRLALLKEPLVKVRMRGNNTYKQVIPRINSRAELYLKTKSDVNVTWFVKMIYLIYFIYSKIFGVEENKVNKLFGKLFLVLPYSLERLYNKKIARDIRNDRRNDKFIK
jgi:glycosyltransferase involved in cell wall biosynthesis